MLSGGLMWIYLLAKIDMTREEAIRILEEYPYDNVSWGEIIEACKMGADALRNAPRWISVEEELPKVGNPIKEGDDVLYWTSNKVAVLCDGGIGIASYTCDKIDDILDEKGYWYPEVENIGDGDWFDENVTHWLPLPSFPVLSKTEKTGKNEKGGEE